MVRNSVGVGVEETFAQFQWLVGNGFGVIRGSEQDELFDCLVELLDAIFFLVVLLEVEFKLASHEFVCGGGFVALAADTVYQLLENSFVCGLVEQGAAPPGGSRGSARA